MWIFKPTLEAASKPHLLQTRGLATASKSVETEDSDSRDSVEHEDECVTEAVATELKEFTGSVAASRTGAVGIEPGVITESVDVEEVPAVAAVLARAA